MGKRSHTLDDQGFDYMANTGREGKDRDLCGILLAVLIMAFLAVSQYLGWY
jgi:hypothetical protein